ncbi:MAG: hypothetical protein XU14_C0033G0021 [Armatimonadetes bacterium CSP1-3]|nr:MAG: hypothetical protein XU14_C0033G0021 [Armatimonadetes bacterium CSP1-3]
MRLFFKGIPAEVPLWVAILQAASGDPLRAQEIESGLSEAWWQRYQEYIREQNKAIEGGNILPNEKQRQ